MNVEVEGAEPFWSDGFATVFSGDAMEVLRGMAPGSVDAVITDPPYSSGGLMRSDRCQKTSAKYVINGSGRMRPEFSGDNRDGRSLAIWMERWLTLAARATRPGGVLMMFSDWRQLPTFSDALQVGGWVWRGIVPWDKTEGVRPQKGWFRAQCEYVLTGSLGGMGKEQERTGVCAPGCFRENGRAKEKLHITGKPLPLMKKLMGVLPEGCTVLDPFAGSGTTLLAAKELGMRCVGVEMSEEYCAVIRDRLAQDVMDFGNTQMPKHPNTEGMTKAE